MALAYLIDENLRGLLFVALTRASVRLGAGLDVVQIGGAGAPPCGTLDPAVLSWAETADRLLISHDLRTMPGHLADHLVAGHHSPGVIVPRTGRLADVTELLVLIALATTADEWRDRVT